MGGQGSGRKPSTETIIKRSQPQITPVGNSIFLPDYSGVKPEALKTSEVDITEGVDWTISQAPAVIHADNYTDTNTDLWSLSGSAIYYNDGNVGIGTTTPSVPLEVSGAFIATGSISGSAIHSVGNITTDGTVDGVDIAARDHDAVTLNASATTGGLSLSTQEISHRAATNAQTGYATAAHITAIEANTAHASDNTQAHSDYLLNSEADTGVGLVLTGDNSDADTAYVPMVLYNTDDTPPAASGFPVGTIYVQYTA